MIWGENPLFLETPTFPKPSAFGCFFVVVEEIFEHSDVEAADVSEKPLWQRVKRERQDTYITATERK